MKDIIVVDIDGTIAKVSEKRLAILKNKPVDWEAFYADDFDDEAIKETIRVIESMYQNDTDVIVYFCTGRKERSREKTMSWLSTNVDVVVCKGRLLMRADDDHRSDTITKPELLAKAGVTPDRVMFILEDRASVTKAYRDLGYTVWQVAEGNY